MWLALMFLNVVFTFAIYVLVFFKETYVIKRIRTDFSLVFSCSDAPDRAITGDVRWLVWENTRLAHLLSPEHWATLFTSKIPCCPVFLFSATLHCWVLLAYSWRSFMTVTVCPSAGLSARCLRYPYSCHSKRADSLLEKGSGADCGSR